MVIQSEPVPLHLDQDGTVRIGNSRVLLDLVVRAYQRGTAPEKIVQSFPTLELADVYGVVSYYLHHRDEVHEYLDRRDIEANELRKEIESLQPAKQDLRDRINKGLAEMKNASSDN
jgi:uncharacterized protein (DUF433 family)